METLRIASQSVGSSRSFSEIPCRSVSATGSGAGTAGLRAGVIRKKSIRVPAISKAGTSRTLNRRLRRGTLSRSNICKFHVTASAVASNGSYVSGSDGESSNGSVSTLEKPSDEDSSDSVVRFGADEPVNGSSASSSTSTSRSVGSNFENGVVRVLDPSAGSAKSTAAVSAVEILNRDDRPWFETATQQKVQVSVTPGGRWNRFKTYSTIQRTFEIWSFVFTFLLKSWLMNQKFMYRKGEMTEENLSAKRTELATWLKEGLLRLGPTFIKIGQQFSTRSDILAPEYIAQLSELQDKVPPFESDVALDIVEKELGKPIYEVFDSFDRDPIAAASLGQVHRARLKGQEVVVKVQRPGLKDLFDIDLKNLRVIAENLQKIDPKSDGAKRDWVAIYDECASVLYEEIDYLKEGENADRFRNNFAKLDYVKVPKIYYEHSTPQILVMEYVPGIKINRIDALDKLGVDKQRLARYSVEAYLEQILSHGFFHADPHPGNIAVDDVNGGRLIFYDFGMMGTIPGDVREGLVDTFYGVYEKDPDKVIDSLVRMGVLVPSNDMTAVRRTAQFFLNSFEERLKAQREEKERNQKLQIAMGPKKALSKDEKVQAKKQRLAAIGEDLLSIAADQPFRFPATFTFVVRAFSVLDGIGKGLDPRFDISEIARPYAMEILRFREVRRQLVVDELKKGWERQSKAFRNLIRQPQRVQKLASVITKLEQGELKLRVRTLENERAFKRVATVQETIGQALATAMFVNMATVLFATGVRKLPLAAATFGAAFFGIQVLVGLFKVKKLDEQERLIMGTA